MLKTPTSGRQTSWILNQFGRGVELGTSGLRVQCANHLATLPPTIAPAGTHDYACMDRVKFSNLPILKPHILGKYDTLVQSYTTLWANCSREQIQLCWSIRTMPPLTLYLVKMYMMYTL